MLFMLVAICLHFNDFYFILVTFFIVFSLSALVAPSVVGRRLLLLAVGRLFSPQRDNAFIY